MFILKENKLFLVSGGIGMKKIFGLLLLVAFLISIFATGFVFNIPRKVTGEAINMEAFSKYDREIEQTSCRVKTAWMTFDGNDDANNNAWTRFIKEKLNIKLTQAWTALNWGQPFDEKINICISTNSLPDNLPVYTTLFFRISQSGKAADLTSLYEKYASPRLKEIENLNNGLALKSSTYNGKLYGLGVPPSAPNPEFVWIRKDWLDRLGLKAPKTINDVFLIAQAFARMGKIGLSLDENFNAQTNFIFNAYGLFPNLWIVKKGKLVRSDVQPEMKAPLKKLAQLYKQGVISKEFVVKNQDIEVIKDLISGKAGIYFGDAYTPTNTAIEESHKRDGANWVGYSVTGVDNKPIRVSLDSRIGNYAASSASNKHPEAIIKMLNLQLEADAYNPNFIKNNDMYESLTGKMNFWCKPNNTFIDPNLNNKSDKAVLAALNSGNSSMLNNNDLIKYNQVVDYEKDKTKGDWGYYTTYKGGTIESALSQTNNYYISPASGPETPAWVQNGQDLSTKVREFFIKAIISGNVDKEFANWVRYFNTQGGKEATTEINNWYVKNKNIK